MILNTEDLLKLLIALALGGLIGAERELRDKDAGLRTLMFICSGSALFTIFSMRIVESGMGDPGRIAAQIVTGIGFLGGGVILRERGEIRGLTTAATIWIAAALGVGVGSGQYLISIAAGVTILAALIIFPYVERMMGHFAQVSTYKITTSASQEKIEAYRQAFDRNRLTIHSAHTSRMGDQMVLTFVASGTPNRHNVMITALFADPEVTEFEV
jgi:putative Mg2+ transporter-C (MgtC) family protein